MQIYTSVVTSCVSTIGLFASGKWKTLKGEMDGFGKGSASYVMILVGIALAWQVFAVGVVSLIFVETSLFYNVTSTVALALCPLAAVVVFHDKMDGVNIIAMLLALWGFTSYLYQNYLDDCRATKAQRDANNLNWSYLLVIVVILLSPANARKQQCKAVLSGGHSAVNWSGLLGEVDFVIFKTRHECSDTQHAE
ncbi:hypothetical protein RJ641_016437 [Dillenia turbinata]|uniref:Purine permease 11 n=1 Tax=Dillenia turbinata TaxID=194707 RepID=A0AAN8YZK9_9MAGN